ncbi:acyltransferase [Comamonas sp. NLF-1-9]|uniref:acyltransferase family protein n=1 Tax=Comamonas sp. NLF-1-9 TaxID=2853163 RepID=UPI001C4521FA|nr:acyltransferase [Comamonas sp. NLF-1-9]QXL83549.1 acyltransferase [Comamonas sp. NLF-1-9]
MANGGSTSATDAVTRGEKPAAALRRRNAGLDYLRSLSIAVVLANHALIGFFFGPGLVRPEGAIAVLSASAVIAIEWLFVLSGFLIGAMMIRSFDKQGRNWWGGAKDFWLRRWFRTIPNYYFFILVNALLVWLGVAEGSFAASYLVFSQNLAWQERVPHFFGESWSLALDEWFYLTLPFMVGLLGLMTLGKKHAFFLSAALLLLMPTAGRWLHATPAEFMEWDAQIRRVTIYHLDATGWGVLAAAINRWYPQWWRARSGAKAALGLVLMLAGLLAVMLLVRPHMAGAELRKLCSVFSITLMGLGTFLAMPWITQKLQGGVQLRRWTAHLSDYTYSIYLAHFPILYLFLHFCQINAARSPQYLAAVVAGWLTATLAVSACIFHGFEKPVSDLRERFTRRVDASPF